MLHRHLNHQRLTLAAIDDIITRGQWADWVELRKTALDQPEVLDKIERICLNFISDPYAQRHHFWFNYVKAHRSPS